MKAEDQHFSGRSLIWRYSLAYDDTEELYDHRSDPNEWKNLAGDPEFQEIQNGLQKQLLNLIGRNQ